MSLAGRHVPDCSPKSNGRSACSLLELRQDRSTDVRRVPGVSPGIAEWTVGFWTGRWAFGTASDFVKKTMGVLQIFPKKPSLKPPMFGPSDFNAGRKQWRPL
jgi:hypothetical protein